MAIANQGVSPHRRWRDPFLPVSIVGAILILVAALLPATASGEAESTPQTELGRSAISRLYFAAFDRPADLDGLDYWHRIHQDGTVLPEIADYFVSSEEFSNTYGDIDNAGLVDLIYQNVLKRPADEDGLNYWVGLLESGHSSGTILNGFAQSPEFDLLTQDQPLEPPPPVFPSQVLMIGDSIFHGIRLLEIPVGSAELTFMTEEGRHVAALPDLLTEANEAGELATSDVVVIHLGTNGWLPEYDAMFDSQIAALAPHPVLVVNTEVARPWESTANDRIAKVAVLHDHVQLVDWNRHVAPHPNWMRADGIHPNRTGLTELAGLIADRILKTYEPSE